MGIIARSPTAKKHIQALRLHTPSWTQLQGLLA